MLLRAILFGGKGGVGKSTLACATALRLSEKGKTLLVSIDPAHSLTGILKVQVGSNAVRIRENLFAVELCAERLVEDYVSKVLSAIGEMMPSLKSGLKEYARYVKHSPTALETAVLDGIADYLEADFQFVVVDSAPTGQMVRIFQTVKVVEGWFSFLEKVAKERQKLETFMGRSDKVFDLIKKRREKVQRLVRILKEKAIIFAVANEERLSIEEALDLEKHLKEFKVYRVMNKWKSAEGNFLKVGYIQAPYGIERLSLLDVEELLEVIAG